MVQYDIPGAYFGDIPLVTADFEKAKACQNRIREERGEWAMMYKAEVDGVIEADTFFEW